MLMQLDLYSLSGLVQFVQEVELTLHVKQAFLNYNCIIVIKISCLQELHWLQEKLF